MKTYWKFAVLVVVIVGAIVWLAAGGIQETKTYYKTVAEVQQMGDQVLGKRLRVGGDVEEGSITRDGRQVSFVLIQEKKKLKVVYNGAEPLPDTFRDGAQALADGKMDSSGVLHATAIQAKCASKYEAKPGSGERPVNVSKAGV